MSTSQALRDATAGNTGSDGALAGKYMIFKLADEEYGIGILEVREIIGLMKITPVPWAKQFVRGVINLRGKVIPVMDCRQKFGMGELQETEQTVIIVVQYRTDQYQQLIGILVDEVLEVLNIPEERIEPPPEVGLFEAETGFILGVGKTERGVIFLLDTRSVLEGAAREVRPPQGRLELDNGGKRC